MPIKDGEMSLSPLWRICAAVAAAVAVGVALGAWWVRSETPPGERVRGAAEGRIVEVPTLPALAAEPAAATDSPPTAPAPELPEVHEIRAACPSLIGELTAECESALERRFVGNWASGPGSFVPGVTYGEIFALDGSTYATVRDALLRPECRVPPGQMRADLGEICAADATARLALLHFVCDHWTVEDPDGTEWLRLESRFENQRWDVEPDNAEWRDQQSYLRGREMKELNAYERSWTYRKCRAMRAGALAWRGFRLDHVADPARLRRWPPRHHRIRHGPVSWWSDPLWESAARLGNGLAFDRLLLIEGQLDEEPLAALFAAMEARNPVFAQAKLSEVARDETAMLAHALAAQMLALLQGLEVEWRLKWAGDGDARMWYWREDGEWVDSWGGSFPFEAHERFEATLEAQRIVARIAAEQGWNADDLDWSQVAAPADR